MNIRWMIKNWRNGKSMKWYLEENFGNLKDLIYAITIVKVNKVEFVMNYLSNIHRVTIFLIIFVFWARIALAPRS